MTTGEIIIIGLLGLSVLLLFILMIRHWMKPTTTGTITFLHGKNVLEDNQEDLEDYSYTVLPYMTNEQRTKQARGENVLIDAEDAYDEKHSTYKNFTSDTLSDDDNYTKDSKYYYVASDPLDEPVRRYSLTYQ